MHAECVRNWEVTGAMAGRDPTCPLCRMKFFAFSRWDRMVSVDGPACSLCESGIGLREGAVSGAAIRFPCEHSYHPQCCAVPAVACAVCGVRAPSI